jgi:hypothetical protein
MLPGNAQERRLKWFGLTVGEFLIANVTEGLTDQTNRLAKARFSPHLLAQSLGSRRPLPVVGQNQR